MPRPKDTSYTGDPEYTKFEQMISDRKLCPATAKSYRASYRKCRNLFQKPIRDTAEDTAWRTIQVIGFIRPRMTQHKFTHIIVSFGCLDVILVNVQVIINVSYLLFLDLVSNWSNL